MKKNENRKTRLRALGIAVGVASACTLGFTYILSEAHIPVTVILPTAAPVWVGIATMMQSLLR